MNDDSKQCRDLWASGIAVAVVVVTMLLTYAVDLLAHLRGSSLAYLGWFLLGGSAGCGFLALRGKRPRFLSVLRNAALLLGLATVGSAVALNIYAERIFSWWPGS